MGAATSDPRHLPEVACTPEAPRYYQVSGLLEYRLVVAPAEAEYERFRSPAWAEYRLDKLTDAETTVLRRYLQTLDATTDPAVLDGWSHRLCGFLGVPVGPDFHPPTGQQG